MSYDISDMSDIPKWRRGVVVMSRHVILSSDISDISDISEMSDMPDISDIWGSLIAINSYLQLSTDC